MKVVVDPERQTCCEQEIGHCQVQDQGVGDGSDVLIPEQNRKNQEVSNQAQDEHDGEKHGGGDGSKLKDFCLVASFIVIVVVIVIGG